MKKQLYTVVLLSVMLASCKGQGETDQPKNNANQLRSQWAGNTYTIEKVNTITALNAPSNITRTLIQDRRGNIWIASWEGIIKYDGSSFTNMTSGVSTSRFFTVLEDHQGNFWFGSLGSGAYFYDGKSFQNFTTREGLVNNRVISIYEDKNGNIWFGTEGGISCFDGKSFRNFTTEQGLSDNEVTSIMEDKTGKFWFGTRGTACIYDPSSSTFTEITNAEGKSFENVRHIIEDSKGNIWLGGKDGLWRYDNKTFMNFSNEMVGYIYEDTKGNIWTSSEKSRSDSWVLSLYQNTPSSIGIVPATEIKTQKRFLFGIVEDADNNIWYSSLNGVYRYNGKSIHYFSKGK